MILKSLCELLLEAFDLVVELCDQRHQRRHDRAVGARHRDRRLQLLGAQTRLELLGPGLDVALATRPSQGARELGARQAPAEIGRRCDRKHRDRIGAGELGAEGFKRLGIRTPAGCAAQAVDVTLALSHEALVGPGQQLDWS